MTFKSFSWGMLFLTLIFLGSFWIILVYTDPEASGLSGQVRFYGALFLFLGSLFSLLLAWLRKKFLGSDAMMSNVGLSIRQGILLSLLFVGLLILQSFRILVWWDGLLVVAGIFLIELYFLSRN